MDEMKMDMSGAAATLGALQAIANLKLKVNVVGIVAAAENMPDGLAIKPGDILKSMSGKTIEVLNTDAEGRLVLADALTYAQRYKPKEVIDLATLTGAVLMALGHQAAAVIGTNPSMIKQLKESGMATDERVWELPLWEEFEKESKTIKSINLDSFSISELREYLIQLDNEILRVKGEIDKKSKTKSQAEDYFNRKKS